MAKTSGEQTQRFYTSTAPNGTKTSGEKERKGVVLGAWSGQARQGPIYVLASVLPAGLERIVPPRDNFVPPRLVLSAQPPMTNNARTHGEL
jgi:hypothetical protein